MLKATVLKDWLDSYGVAAPTLVVTSRIAIGFLPTHLAELER